MKHVPLKEGGQLLQSTDHLLQTGPLFSPIPGSWQQLAGRTGRSSPACQSVHYGEVWEPSRCQRPSIKTRDRYSGMLSQAVSHTSFGNFSKSVVRELKGNKHIFNWPTLVVAARPCLYDLGQEHGCLFGGCFFFVFWFVTGTAE